MPKRLAPGAFYGLALTIAALDQLTKWLVIQKIPVYGSVALLPGVLHFTHVRNDGIAFSMLAGKQWLIILASLAIMAGIVYTERHAKTSFDRFQGIALALPLGGALGNLIDRVRFGLVTDFVDLRVIHFAVFNFADSAITVGILFLFLRGFLQSPPEKSATPEVTDAPDAL